MEVFIWDDPTEFIYLVENNGAGGWLTPVQLTPGGLNNNPRRCLGDMVFNQVNNQLVYKGADQRLQQFWWNGSNWTHGWIDDNWNSAADNVSSTQNSISIMPNGDIAYKGLDNKVHIFTYSTTVQDWVKIPINHNYGAMEFVNGDVVAQQGNLGTIFYKGVDGRLQQFYKDQNGNYVHGWVDNFWNTSQYLVSNRVGSVVSTPNDGILYVAQDNKLWNFNWTQANGWQPTLIPHTYMGAPSNGDYIKGSLAWNEAAKKLYYMGFDGNLQMFYKIGTAWYHGWVDDYWNTSEYDSYVYFNTNQQLPVSPIVIGSK